MERIFYFFQKGKSVIFKGANSKFYHILAVCFLILTIQIFPQKISEKTYSAMNWRLVGPYRAGWATMGVGIPDSPDVFYFGGAGGGVWKSSDAGETWQGLMQHKGASAVGAIAVSLSNPNVIYVGTGQVALRYDMLSGDGVYKSVDGGGSWKNVGLMDSHHIGQILIDPNNHQRVLVAALGHVFADNHERGIFLTTDGGDNWKQVLFVNDETGAVDLSEDPLHPSVIYAALWQMHMHPWLDYYDPETSVNSGIYKSDDGGEHWQKLSGGGLPEGPLGRIGLAVAQGSSGNIVYASIIASAKGKSGLYRSNDAGKNWLFVNNDGSLASSYFSRVTVDPNNADVVYVMGRSISRSEDGGKHFSFFRGAPGGDDYHYLWINPKYPSHMITSSDQGAIVTVNNGQSWSNWYNQPTGQFYHIEVDDQFPYKIYSGQQDNGTVGILSRGPYGVIEDRDWHPVGGDERDYDIPKPGNPNMVFGSGLGGPVSRFDDVTRQSANVSPWTISSYGDRPDNVKYRFTWITPLVFSHIKPYPLYFGAQVLFKSSDDGDHWQVVSPDLSGAKSIAKKNDNPDLAQAKDDGYGVIFSIAPSPISSQVMWIGTDDGLIQLSTDGEKHWRNVTPPSIPLWSRIDAISPSPFSIHSAYASVNTHRTGKSFPLILKTNDDGKNWQIISNGLPKDEYVNVVRTDIKHKGLLFAGTNRSIYVSFNDGDNWLPLTLNFPTTSVRDLVVHDNDLIACTQGRGIWILDDIAPLREISASLENESVHLFEPSQAWRTRGNENRDTPYPPSTPLGQNPPDGAIIDYWLKNDANGTLTLTIKDSQGNIVKEYSSEVKSKTLPSNRYFQKGWVGSQELLSASSGMHRFIWDLRYSRPNSLLYHFSIAGVWDEGTPLVPQGPLVLPGKYSVTLAVDGKVYSKSFLVKIDPRVHVSQHDLAEQLDFLQSINKMLNKAVSIHDEINNDVKGNKEGASSAKSDSLKALLNGKGFNFTSVAGGLSGLSSTVEQADVAPTQGQQNVFAYYKSQFDDLMGRLNKADSKIKTSKK